MIARLFYTLRYLRLIQIWTRVQFCLFKPRVDNAQSQLLKPSSIPWTFSCIKPSFFNEQTNVCSDKLWEYNCHYLDSPDSLQIEKWVKENPPAKGIGWDPYPTSLRIVNFVKWHLARNSLSPRALHSLAVQTRYLSKRLEYHLLGNHLFANAKALIFSGLFFNSTESRAWLKTGFAILNDQIAEQILSDGGHFERSPMYHSIILEDLLDLINLYRVYGEEVPSLWFDIVKKMRLWLQNMSHEDGQIALFNDAAFEITSSPEQIELYAQRLGLEKIQPPIEKLISLNSSGYISLKQGPALAILDVAPIGPDYLPAHAHADTLTFELSLFGRRIIVNSGTSCYGLSKERHRQRSTAAHNTVEIDGQNSSEVWGGFRVARRAYPKDLQLTELSGEIRVQCSHTGYERLKSKNIHRREWCLSSNYLIVNDQIIGVFKQAVSRFFFHPDVKLDQDIEWRCEDGLVQVVDSTWHPRFGFSVPSKCLEVVWQKSECRVHFEW